MQLVENMNEGFQKMAISDPNKLKTFIEGTTGLKTVSSEKFNLFAIPGSIVAILSSLNNVLYSGNPDDIPLTDIEAAAGGYFAQSLL